MYKIRNKKSSYRYERKFLINGLTTDEITSLVNVNSSMFSFAFKKRIINNIYFDNFNFNNYYDNVEGSTDRIKIRIRWYGSMFGDIIEPKLEIKIKQGLLGTKKSIEIDKFNLNDDLSSIFESLSASYIYKRYNLNSTFPVLLNNYTRSYYISDDRSYRITIDEKQSYYKIHRNNNSFLHRVNDPYSKVLEIKYNDLLDENVNTITNNFPFRMTKNSKYVNGMQFIYPN